MAGRILNVCTYGIVVEVADSVAPKTRVSLSIGDYAFQAEGTVVWQQQCGNGFRVGIRSDRALLFYIDARHALRARWGRA